MFRRILIGGLDSHLRFADILLADALTSYAKVLGDAALVVGMYFTGYGATHPHPNRAVGGPFLLPCVIALPYLCRLRQCLIEYLRAADKGLPVAERRPYLYNAAKYASAFPVIILGALQRGGGSGYWSPKTLANAWYLAVLVNSLYSFYWDVTVDWDLSLLSSRRSSPNGEYPYGLRRKRHYMSNQLYYVAVAIDLVLRFTWSIKLSPHLDFIGDMEGGLFMLELLLDSEKHPDPPPKHLEELQHK